MDTELEQIIGYRNKYFEWYFRIINEIRHNRPNKSSTKSIYDHCESHHIIPISFCELSKSNKNNIVHCTSREHFVLHKLLLLACENNKYLKMKALKAITAFMRNGNTQQRIFNSRQYEYARRCAITSSTGTNNPMFGRTKSKNPFYEKTHSTETKKIISEKNSGTFVKRFGLERANEIKKIFSDAKRGISTGKKSDITKQKIGANSALYKWVTDGINNKRILKDAPIQEGWKSGRFIQSRGELNNFYGKSHSIETKRLISNNSTDKYGWYTDGIITIHSSHESAPEGFHRGFGSDRLDKMIGRKNNEETIQKMKIAAKLRWGKRDINDHK